MQALNEDLKMAHIGRKKWRNNGYWDCSDRSCKVVDDFAGNIKEVGSLYQANHSSSRADQYQQLLMSLQVQR